MEISLLQVKSGKNVRITRLEGGLEFQRKLACLNVRVGKTIRKITKQPFRGPLVIEIDNTRVAIGMGMAMRIYVEVKE
jgi:ferrous iron transport protein A